MNRSIGFTSLDPAAWTEALKSYAAEHSACEAWQAAGTLHTMGIIPGELLELAHKTLENQMAVEISAKLKNN